MKAVLEKVNPLQFALVVLLVALLSGVLPLAEGVDLNTVAVALVALIGAAKVMDELTARLLIHELAKIEFADKRLNEFFDKLDMVASATETSAAGATVNITNAPVVPKADVQSSILPMGFEMKGGYTGGELTSESIQRGLEELRKSRQ